MKTVVVICALFCALITAPAATNVTVLSTLAHPETGYQGIGDLSGQSLQSTTAFKTDDTPGQLVSVLLRFFDAYIPSNAPGPFQPSIGSDGAAINPAQFFPPISRAKHFPPTRVTTRTPTPHRSRCCRIRRIGWSSQVLDLSAAERIIVGLKGQTPYPTPAHSEPLKQHPRPNRRKPLDHLPRPCSGAV